MDALLPIILLLGASESSSAQAPLIPRSAAAKIEPLVFDVPGGNWGPQDRTADHATVANNARGDIAVAYHTSRTDVAGHPPLKQVEVAIFLYDSTQDEWLLQTIELTGSIHFDPLTSIQQEKVKCERPDVIAVGEHFFVVWTRRYDGSLQGQREEPAVLECCWLRWNSSTLQYDVLNDSSTFPYPAGWGYALDSNYHVRECAGVPDAVLLDPGDATHDPTVGVVYAHQKDFGDDPNSVPPLDGTRLFDLRLVTCSLGANGVLSSTPATHLISDVVFDGASSAMGDSAGLIVPDCAPMPIPLPVPGNPRLYRIWLTDEEQFVTPAGALDGRIRLRVCEGTAGGTWGPLATHTFGSAANPLIRRRPNVAAYFEDAPPITSASIAFNRMVNSNADLVHEEWKWDEDDGLSKVSTWPAGSGYVSEPLVHEYRPVPRHGRWSPLRRRVYFERVANPCTIEAYDVATNTLSVKGSSVDGLGRPAVAYRYDAVAAREDYALTWEQYEPGAVLQRIWLRVE
jgi:hypothetical protein